MFFVDLLVFVICCGVVFGEFDWVVVDDGVDWGVVECGVFLDVGDVEEYFYDGVVVGDVVVVYVVVLLGFCYFVVWFGEGVDVGLSLFVLFFFFE